MSFSIVTGNGFTGNAQRIEDEPGIYSSNGFSFNTAYNYALSFKYRSNVPFFICNYTGNDLGIGNFGINPGNAIYTSVNMFNAVYLGSEEFGFFLNPYVYQTLSTSTITTSDSTISLTTDTGLSWIPGNGITISLYTQPYFHGSKVSYNSGTGDLVISWTSNSGTGTFSYWEVYNNLGGFVAYSSTVAAVPTGAGNTTLNIGTGKTVASNVAAYADDYCFVSGTVVSYNPSTGAMVVSRSSSVNDATASSWRLDFTDTPWLEVDEVYLYTL